MVNINNREEKDMEFKIKENVNVNGFTFRKKVMEEMEGIKNYNRNYSINDIKFFTMITFLNNISEDEKLLIELAKQQDLIPFMEKEVEPLYEKYILHNEDNLKAFNEIVEDLIGYYERENKNYHHITGMIYNILEEIGDLEQKDIIEVIKNVSTTILKLAEEGKMNVNIFNKDNDSKKKILTDEKVKDDIKNSKMQQLIDQYKVNDNK